MRIARDQLPLCLDAHRVSAGLAPGNEKLLFGREAVDVGNRMRAQGLLQRSVGDAYPGKVGNGLVAHAFAVVVNARRDEITVELIDQALAAGSELPVVFVAPPVLRVQSDIDSRAVAVARQNVRLNHVGSLVRTLRADGVGVRAIRRDAPFGIAFANILLPPLRRLAQPLAALLAPGAHLILSGLLVPHANAAIAAYRAQGLVLERRLVLEGWVTLVLRRPAG